MENKSDVKSTKAYNILVSLHDDHSIDDDAFLKFEKKLEKMQDCLVNYMEYEKLLDKRFNALKEENTKNLNEYSLLTKQQAELNDKIGQKLEEREQAKSQLTEYETNRALKSNYELERNQEEIQRLLNDIKETEEKQKAALQKELDEIDAQNKKRIDEINVLKNKIEVEEAKYKEMEDLKNKLLLNNKKIDKEISDLNSNIESKVSQIENDKRTNLLNETALKKLSDEIHKKQQNVKNIEESREKLSTQNNSIQSNINISERGYNGIDIDEITFKDYSFSDKETKNKKKEKIFKICKIPKDKKREFDLIEQNNNIESYLGKKRIMNRIDYSPLYNNSNGINNFGIEPIKMIQIEKFINNCLDSNDPTDLTKLLLFFDQSNYIINPISFIDPNILYNQNRERDMYNTMKACLNESYNNQNTDVKTPSSDSVDNEKQKQINLNYQQTIALEIAKINPNLDHLYPNTLNGIFNNYNNFTSFFFKILYLLINF